jgi:hypothetical protein
VTFKAEASAVDQTKTEPHCGLWLAGANLDFTNAFGDGFENKAVVLIGERHMAAGDLVTVACYTREGRDGLELLNIRLVVMRVSD